MTAGGELPAWNDISSYIRYLRDVEGWTYKAIGAKLDISKQAAHQAYIRASRPRTQQTQRKPRRKPLKYQ